MTPRLILVIAGLTLREVARRRILWVLLLLSVASVVLVGWGVERLVTIAREQGVDEVQIRIGVSQVLIMIAFQFSFVLAMSAAFLAAPAIASDVETGTVLAMLARPMRRADLVIGRWLGLSVVVAGYAAVSGLMAIGWLAGSAVTRRRRRWLPWPISRSSRLPYSRWRWRLGAASRASPQVP